MKSYLKCLLAAVGIMCAAACSSKNDQQDLLPVPQTVDDLRSLRIGVGVGFIQEIEFTANGFGDQLLKLPNYADLLVSVQSGHCDCFLIDSVAAIGAGFEEKGIRYLMSCDPSGDYGMCFRKNDFALCNEINSYLEEIRSDGFYQELLQWYTSEEFMTDPARKYDFDPDGKPLRIGISNIFPFAYMKDLEWTGLDLDIIYEFARRKGYKPEVINMDFPAMIPALISNKVDVASSAITITEERAKQVLFSNPYYGTRSACFGMGYKFFPDAQKPADAPKQGFFKTVKESFHNNFIVEDRWKMVVDGFWETIIISLFSIIFGTLLGALLCFFMFSRNRVTRSLTSGFCTLVSGLPMLVFLMVMFYIVFASAGLSGRAVAIIAFAINFACSACGIFYAGIDSVDRGQTEAGLALGFTPLRTFTTFVLPQAAKKVLPLYRGEVVSLIKETSIVGYIAIQDLTKVSDIIRSRTYDAFFPLIAISIVYFLLAWGVGKLIDSLGKVKA